MASNYTTGQTVLPDGGTLSYNGVTFSSYFVTKMEGKAIKDAANRTVKYMEYTLTVDGYVTLGSTNTDIESTMALLRRKLDQQGGALTYKGRGFGNLDVNQPGSSIRDVAWGPVPETLDFEPLGAARSAHVVWTVVIRLPEYVAIARRGGVLPVALQFNEETTVEYDEEAYSQLSIKGTLEIPMTRRTVDDRTVPQTADDFRQEFIDRFFSVNQGGIDLTRFRVTRREFNISRDKRTLEWSVEAAELPWMGIPPFCTAAHGTYEVKPAKSGLGLVLWLCTLRGTYTVAKNEPRRVAWLAFLAMLQRRMRQSTRGHVPANAPAPAQQNPALAGAAAAVQTILLPTAGPIVLYNALFRNTQDIVQRQGNRALLVDFNVSEPLYLDSRTVTFSATWRIVTTISHILLASGLWKRPADIRDPNVWATSVRNISGWTSWLENRLDPAQDVIVDMGGP